MAFVFLYKRGNVVSVRRWGNIVRVLTHIKVGFLADSKASVK